MPTLDEISEFVHTNLELPTVTRNGTHFHTRCPICGDSKYNKYKKRFHVQYRSDEHTEYNCFNCNESGDFYSLYAHVMGISSEEAYNIFNRYNPERITKKTKKTHISENRIKHKESLKNKDKPYECFNYILNDCISLEDEPDGYIQKQFQNKLKEFIENRKVDIKLYVAYEGRFKGRIIIPVWYGEDIIYFQGRAIHEDMEPKYLNPSVYKSNVILNKSEFDLNKYIVTCEGLLDAHSVGKQGTSFLGKELDEIFLQLLFEHTNKGVIVVMDNDDDGIEKLREYINKYRKKDKIRFFLMPKKYSTIKDLNDILKNINISDMYKFVVENSFSNERAKIELLLRHKKR